jgi:hypothetical protein
MSKLDALERMFGLMMRGQQFNYEVQQDEQRRADSIAQQQASERAQSLQFIRSIASGYVDLYEKAPSTAYKTYYQRVLGQLTEGLPDSDRAALRPLVAGTPLDPIKEMEARFERMVGPRPELYNGEVPNDALLAKSAFAQTDYDARKRAALTGLPLEKPETMTMLQDGKVAVRDDNGRAFAMTREDFETSEQAKAWGTNFAEFKINKGIISSEPTMIYENGIPVQVHNRYDAINRKALSPIASAGELQRQLQEAQVRYGRQKLSNEQSKIQLDLKTAFVSQDTRNPAYAGFEQWVKDGGDPQQYISDIVAPSFPGNTVLIDKGKVKRGVFGTYASIGDQFSLRILKGVPVWSATDKSLTWVYDKDSGSLLTPEGERVDWQNARFGDIAPQNVAEFVELAASKNLELSQEKIRFERENPGILMSMWNQLAAYPQAKKGPLFGGLSTDIGSLPGFKVDAQKYPHLAAVANPTAELIYTPFNLMNFMLRSLEASPGELRYPDFVKDYMIYNAKIGLNAAQELGTAAAKALVDYQKHAMSQGVSANVPMGDQQ